MKYIKKLDILASMISITKNLLRALLILFAIVIFSDQPFLYAQVNPPSRTVDRATREVDIDLRKKAEKKLKPLPKIKPKAVKASEEEEDEGELFLVERIDLIGAESLSSEEFENVLSDYEGKMISLKTINRVAKEVEKIYIKNGVLAACIVPPQDATDGTVELKVIEAKMGDLRVSHSQKTEEDILKFYWKMPKGKVLRYDKLNQSLFYMNKNPDREVTATLHAGSEQGTTDVLLESKTYFPLHFFYSYDNEGSASTGVDRNQYGFRHNNLLFVDDIFLGGYTSGKDLESYYFYHLVPLTQFGATLLYGYSDSRSYPQKELAPFQIESRSTNYSIYFSQDLFYMEEYFGEISMGMDRSYKHTEANYGTVSRDITSVGRIKANIIHIKPSCVTFIQPRISQGFNLFHARSRNELSSRGGGVDNNFTICDITINHKRKLPIKGMRALIKFRGLFSSERVPANEGLALGGMDSVRGYPAQDFVADNGYLLNCELEIPLRILPEKFRLPYSETTINDDLKGFLFCDYGIGNKRGDMLWDEPNSVHYLGVGAGLEFKIYNQVTLRLAWGFPVADPSFTESADSRFHISINVDENLHREIERVRATSANPEAI